MLRDLPRSAITHFALRLGTEREYGACLFIKPGRLKLPVVTLQALFPRVDEAPVTLTTLPTGPWATPIADVVALLKIISLVAPRHVLELGSYRGYTARAIAEHLDAEARVTAVDLDPAHGQPIALRL